MKTLWAQFAATVATSVTNFTGISPQPASTMDTTKRTGRLNYQSALVSNDLTKYPSSVGSSTSCDCHLSITVAKCLGCDATNSYSPISPISTFANRSTICIYVQSLLEGIHCNRIRLRKKWNVSTKVKKPICAEIES